jgi:hypothetical protein
VSTGAYRYRASIVLHAPESEARARVAPNYGTLEAIDARRCRLSTGASSLDGLAIGVSMIGLPFEVESPPELAAHCAALATRLGDAAGRSRGARPAAGKRTRRTSG